MSKVLHIKNQSTGYRQTRKSEKEVFKFCYKLFTQWQ